MERYGKARIYRLVGGGKTYYGSTCETLSRRLSGHKADYKSFINGKRSHTITSFELLEEPDLNIVLVEEYPCENKDQLKARERWWIDNNECINKQIPTRSKSEWYEANKDKINERHKKWYLLNKSKEKEKQKKYREDNNDAINKYRQQNKEKLNERKRSYRLNVKIDKIFGLYEQED
jgi:hypothetical protein